MQQYLKSLGILVGALFTVMACLLLGCKAKLSSGTEPLQPVGVQQPAVIQADPAWFGCRVDRDCALERGLCNSAQAVNKAFIPQFKAYRDQMEQQIGCTFDAAFVLGQKTQCIQHRCGIKSADKNGQAPKKP